MAELARLWWCEWPVLCANSHQAHSRSHTTTAKMASMADFWVRVMASVLAGWMEVLALPPPRWEQLHLPPPPPLVCIVTSEHSSCHRIPQPPLASLCTTGSGALWSASEHRRPRILLGAGTGCGHGQLRPLHHQRLPGAQSTMVNINRLEERSLRDLKLVSWSVHLSRFAQCPALLHTINRGISRRSGKVWPSHQHRHWTKLTSGR